MKLIKTYIYNNGKYNATYGLYKCKCGKEFGTLVSRVKSGGALSCGCLRLKRVIEAKSTHKLSKNKDLKSTYACWIAMKQRCSNKNNQRYQLYGGRGISVCKEWLSFETFLNDMGKRPSKDLSLNRINNDLGYFKDNCRWDSRQAQESNKKPAKGKSSQYKGVMYSKQKNKFHAKIQVNGKQIHLLFSDKEKECAAAYNKAALKYFGKDAYINEISLSL